MAYVKRLKRRRRRRHNIPSRRTGAHPAGFNAPRSGMMSNTDDIATRLEIDLENVRLTEFRHLNDYMNYGYQEMISWLHRQGLTIGDIQDDNLILYRGSTRGALVPTDDIGVATPEEYETMVWYDCAETMSAGRSVTYNLDGSSCFRSFGEWCHHDGEGGTNWCESYEDEEGCERLLA